VISGLEKRVAKRKGPVVKAEDLIMTSLCPSLLKLWWWSLEIAI